MSAWQIIASTLVGLGMWVFTAVISVLLLLVIGQVGQFVARIVTRYKWTGCANVIMVLFVLVVFLLATYQLGASTLELWR